MSEQAARFSRQGWGRTSRGRLWVRILVPLVVVVVGFEALAWIRTQYLWFRSVGDQSVFTTLWVTRLVLALVFGAVDFAWVAGTMYLAYRLRPRFRSANTSVLLLRYRAAMDLRLRLAVGLPAAFVALWGAASGAGAASTFLAWRNQVPFGRTDPYFGLDVSFFVFTYPWLTYLVDHLIAMAVIGIIAAGAVHLMVGGFQGMSLTHRGEESPRAASAHLSVLVALLMIALGLSALLGRYGYEMSDNSLFTGVSYTDQHVRFGAKLVVAIVAFICAGLFILNAWTHRWSLGWLSLILLLVTSIILLGIYPATVQRFKVRPSEPQLEAPYIANHISATRAAYGLSNVKTTPNYAATQTANAGQLKADAEALPSIRLMDPAIVAPTFEALQQKQNYYTFPPVLDVDHYTLDGVSTDAVVAAREINTDAIPDKTWTNLHTVYTHGYGVVAAYGNRRTGDEPVWIEGGLPPTGALNETQGRIYFGEQSSNYVVVGAPQGTPPVELDTPALTASGSPSLYTYTGTGGVPIGNWFDKLLFATRLNDLNLLLSNRVNSDSRILTDRQPVQRVQQVAPWLVPDSDPYPTVVDGRVVWVIDGYTMSANYPDSQQVGWQAATSDSASTARSVLFDRPVNYVRNAVKATVDAYDGTVTLYAWDESDPILKTWEKTYPGLVKPKASIPADLLKHLRYPQDLFTVQRTILARYHATDPVQWLQKSDLWQVPDDPTRPGSDTQPPYYLSVRWPGDSQPVFSLTSGFTPSDRSNLIAYMSVDADASSPGYGTIRVLRMADTVQVPGPAQTYSAINSNEAVAAKLRLFLGQGSSSAIYGNLLALPVGGGLLYVEPVYTQTTVSSGGYPALRFVVVRFGEHVGIGDTLQQALDQVFQGNAGASTGEGNTSPLPSQPSGSSPGADAARKLLQQAQQAYEAAAAALKQGDLAGYAKQVGIAQQKTAEALAALNR
ncbi:MAG TPA: UPF0182 family protein [Propionibacteriaceae bacterium]|nr:UPF0182 family protein [Propionibacteriaceae bacterium]